MNFSEVYHAIMGGATSLKEMGPILHYNPPRTPIYTSHVICNFFLNFFFFFQKKWLSKSVEGLLSTGPIPSSFTWFIDKQSRVFSRL